MATDISTWLMPEIKAEGLQQENGIFLYMNNDFVDGDNHKYMKMYDWMSYVYDFGEKWIGRLKFGRGLEQMRTELMSVWSGETISPCYTYLLVQGPTCVVCHRVSTLKRWRWLVQTSRWACSRGVKRNGRRKQT